MIGSLDQLIHEAATRLPVHCCTGAPSDRACAFPRTRPSKPLWAAQVICCTTVFPADRVTCRIRWQVACTRCVRWLRAALGVS